MKVEWSVDPSEFANVSNLEDPERLSDVIDAVENLPPDEKAVIDAIFWERLSPPAAQRALGIGPAEFARRFESAKIRLAQMLGNDTVGLLSTDSP